MFDFSTLEEQNITINHSTSSSSFTLMHKDIPLIFIDEDKELFEVFYDNYHFLPYGLKAYKNFLKYVHFVNWAVARVLLLDRDNAKKLLNACNLSQIDNYSVAKACRLLSVDDCFWLRENDDEKWDDFNLRKNSLSKALAQIALEGVYITISGDVTTPEFTNQGSFPKSWNRNSDTLYLLKKSKEHYESEREVLASKILDLLGVNHVKYCMQEPKSDHICMCACMTSDKYSRLNFGEFRLYCKEKGFSALGIINEHYYKEFAAMLVVDYVLANTDRHSGNWGFYVNNDTGNVVGLHPLYDHNNSFDETFNDEYRSVILPAMSMLSAAMIAQKDVKLPLEKLLSLDKQLFIECEADYDSFIKRVNRLL